MLLGRLFAKGKDSPDIMLRVALGDIFVEGYVEKFSKQGRNERCKISNLVATLGRGNDGPIAGVERMIGTRIAVEYSHLV